MRHLFMLLLLIATTLSTVFAQTQITIDQGDMPKAGEKLRFSIADTLLMVDPAPTGPNYSWDFRTLKPIFQNLDSFISRNDLPITLRFSVPNDVNVVGYINANVEDSALGGISLSGGYDLFRSGSSAFESLGQGTVLSGILPIVLAKDPIDTVYRFPMDYGNQDSSFSIAELDLSLPGVGNVYVYQERNRVNEVDGWGTLMTPFGQFDVLRVKTYITGYDSVKLDTTIDIGFPSPPTIEYKWLAKGIGIPVLQVNVNVLGGTEIVGQISYRDSTRKGVPTVGIEDKLEPLQARAYPNPATELLRIDMGEFDGRPVQLQLIDLQGRVVREELIRERSSSLQLEGLATGVYVLSLKSGNKRFIDKIEVR